MRNLIQSNFLSALKQYQPTILQFWKSEVRNESYGTKTQGLAFPLKEGFFSGSASVGAQTKTHV